MAASTSTSSTDRPVTTLDHAHLMDRIYAHQRHIYDVTRAYYLLGRNQHIAEISSWLVGNTASMKLKHDQMQETIAAIESALGVRS